MLGYAAGTIGGCVLESVTTFHWPVLSVLCHESLRRRPPRRRRAVFVVSNQDLNPAARTAFRHALCDKIDA